MSQYSVVRYIEEDYDSVNALFVKHGWNTSPPRGVFPHTGFIAVTEDAKVIAGVFLFVTSNSGFGMLDYGVVDPDFPKAMTIPALRECIAKTKQLAYDLGISYLVSWSANKGFIKLLRNAGFKVGEPSVTCMVLAPEGETKLDFITDGEDHA